MNKHLLRSSIESVIIVGNLDSRNAAVNTGMGSEEFARFIGLTPTSLPES